MGIILPPPSPPWSFCPAASSLPCIFYPLMTLRRGTFPPNASGCVAWRKPDALIRAILCSEHGARFWKGCARVGWGSPSAALRAGDVGAHLGCSSWYTRIFRLLLDKIMKTFYRLIKLV